MRPAPRNARYGWMIASRTLAATLGGYAVSSLVILVLGALAPGLGVRRAQAVHATTMGSFILYAIVIMAVFHTSSATRAWLGLLAVSLPLAIAALALTGGLP